ncbi:KH domain-containing, RNA-binding, signal transduction-associated protein 3 [Tupaia chinensis]|uniref:KH domain-containing, RNA-binding, signal transduction-associated protein 3 n=1 Tax=Tupaia chinensis TaxID=246437 RepID=L9KL61_TUPCH|nr:KH domain-containing, RNA-binding, signal transduction-associated protein 3 [Tupaia chinensis]
MWSDFLEEVTVKPHRKGALAQEELGRPSVKTQPDVERPVHVVVLVNCTQREDWEDYDDGYGTAYDDQSYDSYDNSYSTPAQSCLFRPSFFQEPSPELVQASHLRVPAQPSISQFDKMYFPVYALDGADYYDYGHGLSEETYDSYGRPDSTRVDLGRNHTASTNPQDIGLPVPCDEPPLAVGVSSGQEAPGTRQPSARRPSVRISAARASEQIRPQQVPTSEQKAPAEKGEALECVTALQATSSQCLWDSAGDAAWNLPELPVLSLLIFTSTRLVHHWVGIHGSAGGTWLTGTSAPPFLAVGTQLGAVRVDIPPSGAWLLLFSLQPQFIPVMKTHGLD